LTNRIITNDTFCCWFVTGEQLGCLWIIAKWQREASLFHYWLIQLLFSYIQMEYFR